VEGKDVAALKRMGHNVATLIFKLYSINTIDFALVYSCTGTYLY